MTVTAERARITTLFSLGLLDSRPELQLDRITRLAQRLFDVPIALISLVDHDRQWFKSNIGLDVAETPRDISFCTHAIEGLEPMVVEDATTDPRFARNPLVTDDPSIRFYAGAPITAPDGRRLGTLCVIDRRPREVDPADVEALVELADLVDHEIQLRYVASIDASTGLLNHRGFFLAASRMLVHARATGSTSVLTCLHVVGMRDVKERWGHDEAELVTGDLATMLRDHFDDAVIGRLSGDEFVVLTDGPLPDVGTRLARFRRDLASWSAEANLGADLGVHVGIEVASPEDDLSVLLERADRAATLDARGT